MFLDVHAHMYKYPYPLSYNREDDQFRLVFPNGEELIRLHDELGIDRAVILPLVSAEVYVPQSVGEVIEFANQSNGRFIPFCNLDPRQGGNGPETDFVRYLTYYKSRGAVAMGEVTANVYLDDERMLNLLRCCEKTDMPVLFHFGNMGNDYGVVDDPGFPRLRRILREMPNLKVIGHSPKFWENTCQVKQMMEEYPNLYCEFSSISGGKAILADPEFTYAFFDAFPDRIFYATDFHAPNNLEQYDVYQRVADFLEDGRESGRISEKNYRLICRENALRLLGGTL